ncbi:MAG: alpha/beta fold hydrolase [Actinomycetota bacterium]|nr:alpha/beta fold hydrolase [Actinomycetota bacterium]
MSRSWSPQSQPPWPGNVWDLGRHRLYVRSAPPVDRRAEPAVMVHGLGGRSANWTDLMELLRHRLASVAPDLPGFGLSAPPDDGDYGLDALTASVRGVVERHGAPVHLFGNSLGGAVCVRLAARRPDLVRSLVLVSPALPDLRPRRTVVGVPVLAVPGLGEQMWRQLARLPVERQVQSMLELNFGDPSVVSPSRRAEAVAEFRRRFTLPYAGDALSRTTRGLLRAFVEPGPTGLWREASRLQLPCLVLYGGRDRLVDPRRARRAARTIPDARVVTLPTVGHMGQVEQPALVARLVGRFLDGAATV